MLRKPDRGDDMVLVTHGGDHRTTQTMSLQQLCDSFKARHVQRERRAARAAWKRYVAEERKAAGDA